MVAWYDQSSSFHEKHGHFFKIYWKKKTNGDVNPYTI